jgi:hypothetical protein
VVLAVADDLPVSDSVLAVEVTADDEVAETAVGWVSGAAADCPVLQPAARSTASNGVDTATERVRFVPT